MPAHHTDPAAILQFEATNRDHFRQWIPDRGDDYYTPSGVAASLEDARRWWNAGTDLLHVVLDPDGLVVARANLVDITQDTASVGYRVAEQHQGQGIASDAVTHLLNVASARDIRHVHALTATSNIGSARVLRRCGFIEVATRPAALTLDDHLLDATEWRAEPATHK